MSFPAVLALGDGAFTVALGDRVERTLHRRVLGLSRAIAGAGLPGVSEIVPAYAAVTVYLTPDADPEAIERRLLELARTASDPLPDDGAEPSRLVAIPVRYDGPDLGDVAERTGLTREDVVRLHAGREYEVYLLGFAPGFGFLGELDPALRLPRRSSPRTRVPAGSVAIAGAQTAVYPLETPGGWHLIGRTDLVMFDRERNPPALLRPGDRVRFEPTG